MSETTHVWIAGNASAPLVADTLCGIVAECNPNREEASCTVCKKKLKEKLDEYHARVRREKSK